MPAPRDSDLAVYTYHRHTITYQGVAAALAGTAIGYNGLAVVSVATPVFGVLEADVTTGQDVTIAVAGICQMIAGAAVPIGSAVTINAASQAIVGAAGQQLFGRALSAATAVGQKIQVLITREGTN